MANLAEITLSTSSIDDKQETPINPFDGSRVAITGGTSGLGLALVRELLRRGARVAFVARGSDRVERVARELPGTHGIVGDISAKDDIYPIALQIVGELGGLDVLINNASDLGPTPLAMLSDTECEDLERAFATNVFGPFRLTKALMGALAASAREGRGAVVLNISSDAAINPYPTWGAYGASKAALHHLTRIWTEEHEADGVRFLSLDPGDMDTPMHAAAMPEADPTTLKRPEVAASELADAIAAVLPRPWETSTASKNYFYSRKSNSMIAADRAVQRPPYAKLLVVDARRRIGHAPRSALVEFLRSDDLVIANDAATLPASLLGVHQETEMLIEVRLAGRPSLRPEDVGRFSAVVFGQGNFRMRTEDRPSPPQLVVGDRLDLGPLRASVERLLDHPRFVSLIFDGTPDQIWAGLAHHGRPIQYAHIKTPLALWDVWTRIAGPPVAFESPSAGFALDWHVLATLRERGTEFATITHAAGISSTGDDDLDHLLPFDEPYRIPEATAGAIRRAKARGGRVVAVGTSVVRALENAATGDGQVEAGEGLATQHLGPTSRLRVVDAILSGTHERGTSHYELLRAFLDDATLVRTSAEMEAGGYRTHEFGDSVFIEYVSLQNGSKSEDHE